MVDVTANVKNAPVSVTLGDSETYSPSAGSVEDVTIVVAADADLNINGKKVVEDNSASGEPNTSAIDVVLTDSDTVEALNLSGPRGAHISGYQVDS